MSFFVVYEMFGEVFGKSPDDIVVKLLDFEGDLIRLKKQEDLDYALLHAEEKRNLFVKFEIFEK